jgi:hypothetical protein
MCAIILWEKRIFRSNVRNKRCRESGNEHTYFKELAKMRKQLAAMGKTLNEDECVDHLFASFPSSNQPAVNAINASS